MNTQTTDSRSRKKHYGWWISIIVIGTIAALQTAVIIDIAVRGQKLKNEGTAHESSTCGSMRSPRRGKLVQAEALKVVPTGPAQGHGPHGDGLGAYTLELPMAVTGREKSGLERYDELFLDIVVSHLDDLPVVAENEALEQRASSIERSMTGISDGENHVLKQAVCLVRSLISNREQ